VGTGRNKEVVNIDGVSYALSLGTAHSVHITLDQSEGLFSKSPLATSLCGVDVFEFEESCYLGKRVCRSCYKKAWARGLKPPYRLSDQEGS